MCVCTAAGLVCNDGHADEAVSAEMISTAHHSLAETHFLSAFIAFILLIVVLSGQCDAFTCCLNPVFVRAAAFLA